MHETRGIHASDCSASDVSSLLELCLWFYWNSLLLLSFSSQALTGHVRRKGSPLPRLPFTNFGEGRVFSPHVVGCSRSPLCNCSRTHIHPGRRCLKLSLLLSHPSHHWLESSWPGLYDQLILTNQRQRHPSRILRGAWFYGRLWKNSDLKCFPFSWGVPLGGQGLPFIQANVMF